jgi:peptidoglycan/xylan/chitin deacetylase (PgdA/CDA1 family)
MSKIMRILLTFDVEVWCNGWENLDQEFPSAFERYVYGRSAAGSFALPETLRVLRQNRLRAVFFVEPLFAARFGTKYLREIVALILDAGQEVQLHLHPEWVDEITPPPIPDATRKRQYVREYTVAEQTILLALGAQMLQDAGAPKPSAFRAGNFAANRDTFKALAECGFGYDSSVNATSADSVPDLRDQLDVYRVSAIDGVISCPITVFRDGIGRLRHAQVGACSTRELVDAIQHACELGWRQFVVLSHNFELLKVDSTSPDRVVVDRFRRLCDFLGRQASQFPTSGFDGLYPDKGDESLQLPKVGGRATLRRYGEQAIRRML